MAKILLVEDDKSLREIYGVRLMAEGYDIVSAGDGEEALAMAIKERPDLIVSDVMMPKISGFDMLDILRSTTETRDVKVIMMTALSSDDQRARGEALGADRYLVKSQVGIEDVVRTVHDVLSDGVATAPRPAAAPVAQSTQSVAAQPTAAPVSYAAPQPAAQPAPPAYQPIPAAPVYNPEPVTQAAYALQPAAPTYQEPYAQPAATPPPFDPLPPQPFAQPAAQPAPQQFAEPAFTQPQQPAQQFQPASAPAQPAAQQYAQPAPQPYQPQPAASAAGLPQPTAPFSTPAPASLGERVIEPLTSPSSQDNPAENIAYQMEQALTAHQAQNGGTTPTPPTQPLQ